MKALVLDQPGPPRNWRITSVPDPAPEAGEVLVQVHAVGLNPADYKIAAWGNPAWRYPFIMGLDVAGTILALGEGVTGWQAGDRIYYHGDFSRPGGFAELTTIPAHVIAPAPSSLTFEQAASVPCSAFAAYQGMFRKMQVQPGMKLLVQGGAGGVGSYALQLAKFAGAEVITTTSARNGDYVRSLGADHVIDYEHEDVAQRVAEITSGHGADVILDAVSQATTTAALELLAFGGHLICVDSLPDLTKIRPFAKALSLHEIALGVAHLSGDRQAQAELALIARAVGRLLDEQRIRPTLSRTVALEDVPSALEEMAGRQVRGKIVAQVR
jgi:NADPH:quinone reductase-like Zn-dependent oxidoreductase